MRNTENPILFHTDMKIKSSSNLISARRLNASEELVQWVIANQVRPTDTKLRQKTPTDDDGMQYWISRTQNREQEDPPLVLPKSSARDIEESRLPPASVAPGKGSKYPNIGGCYYLSLLLNASDTAAKPTTIKILSDWERLWMHLLLDKSDDIGRHVPVLRTCLRFFLHKKTLIIVWFLFIYNLGVQLLYDFLTFTGSLSFAALFSDAITFAFNLAFLLLYTYFYRLYNGGKTSSTPHDPASNHLLKEEEVEEVAPVSSSERLVDAVDSMIHQMLSLCKSLVRCECRDRNHDLINRHAVSSYDQLLNTAFKFLVRHCKVDVKDINLSERGYKMAFLFIFTILPIYLTVVLLVGIYYAVEVCNVAGQSSLTCQIYVINIVLNLGGLTQQLFSFFVYSTMVLSMIGLSYGSELAFFMIGAWLQRYSNLRRVSHGEDQEDSAPPSSSQHEDKCAEAETEVDQELDNLTPHLTRDATEHYLFIVEYLRQCGALWSTVIVVVYIYAFVLTFVIVGAFAILPASQLEGFSAAQYSLVFVLQVLLFITFPTWSLAHVNAYISHIEELFKNASEEDFKIIGSRESALIFFSILPTINLFLFFSQYVFDAC
jgi:hypothetical protein